MNHRQIIDTLEMVAQKSHCRYKVSCVLTDNRGRIVSTGYNHLSQRSYGMYGTPSTHAEADALRKVRKPSKNLVAYIYREGGLPIDPCVKCSALLNDYGIRKIFLLRRMGDSDGKQRES